MNRRRLLLAGLAASLPGLAHAQSTPTPEAFLTWVSAAEDRARRDGLSDATIVSARTGLRLNPDLVRPAGADAESRRVGRYVQGLINGDGQRARAKRAANPRLADIEQRFGVPASVLVAFWGRESSYGADFGRLDVFSTLATQGAGGKGSSDWIGEYVAALRIVESGARQREALKGSSAGALGHTQLMPSSYLTYGEDFDGDGRVDVWAASPLDALASAARHIQDVPRAGQALPKEGKAWRTGRSWIVPVTLPVRFDVSKIDVEETRLTPRRWEALGVSPAEPWRSGDADLAASLALPAGLSGPALLLFPNYDVFERYNPSRTYALGVGLLARHIDGAAPVAWPEEAPLSLAEREAAQRALMLAGLYAGPIDGDLGAGSRRAVRAWQKLKSLPADGYLTSEMVRAMTG